MEAVKNFAGELAFAVAFAALTVWGVTQSMYG